MILRKSEATAKGGPAYERLLRIAETRDSGQVQRIALFIASTYDGEAFPFDPFELRAVDERRPRSGCDGWRRVDRLSTAQCQRS